MIGRTHNLKSARLAKRRRNAMIWRTFFLLFCLLGVWGGIFLVSGLEAINIRSVEVSGTTSIAPTKINEIAQSFFNDRYFYTVPRTSVLFYPKRSIEDKILETFPQVVGVSVGFVNLHTIGISVVERVAIASWCQEKTEKDLKGGKEECFSLDNSGIIFASDSTVASTSATFVKFYSAVQKENPIRQVYTKAEYFQNLLNFAKDLSTAGFGVSKFIERPDSDFEAKLIEGARLIIGLDSDFASIVSNFKTIVSDPSFGGADGLAKVDYIDLRYGNKVYYKVR